MTRRRLSAGQRPSEPLEYLLDRSLGRNVSNELERLGWIIHRITDEFPNDAQDVPDEDWIRHGVRRGWVPLSKDGRIRGRSKERGPLEEFSAVLFYLDNQTLRIAEMVARFDVNRSTIERAVRRGGPAMYAVRAEGLRKTWP